MTARQPRKHTTTVVLAAVAERIAHEVDCPRRVRSEAVEHVER